jgi:hypothetical protein
MENPNVMDEGNTKSNTPQEWTIGSNPEDLGIVVCGAPSLLFSCVLDDSPGLVATFAP